MAYFDVRTGHALLGSFPSTYGRYTMGAASGVDYNIDAIASALLDSIGQISINFGKVIPGLGKLKLEELVPDEIEVVINTVLSTALSKYVQSQFDLSKDATANNVADAISADLINKIRPKLMDYVGVKQSDSIAFPVFMATMDVARTSLKSAIKNILVKIGKAAGAKENPYGINSPNPYGGKSSIPIIPIAIGAGVLVLVLLLK